MATYDAANYAPTIIASSIWSYTQSPGGQLILTVELDPDRNQPTREMFERLMSGDYTKAAAARRQKERRAAIREGQQLSLL